MGIPVQRPGRPFRPIPVFGPGEASSFDAADHQNHRCARQPGTIQNTGTQRCCPASFLLPAEDRTIGRQLCALDIIVANDQSGLVSAIENTRSLRFISALFQGMQRWDTVAGESRKTKGDVVAADGQVDITGLTAGSDIVSVNPQNGGVLSWRFALE